MTRLNRGARGNGRFIVFEGLDASGVTTQAKLLKTAYEKQGNNVFYTKEPTQGPIGMLLRLVLLNRMELDHDTVALLFAADRMDHLTSDIIPRLNNGLTVLADRYYLSSMAYQSLKSDSAWVRSINSRCAKPDLMIYFDVSPQTSQRRMKSIPADRFKLELFDHVSKLNKVRENYLRAIEDLRKTEEQWIEIIDGEQSIDEVHNQVVQVVLRANSMGRFGTGREPQKAAGNEVEALNDEEIRTATLAST